MKPSRLAPLAAVLMAVFLNGCATSKLWESNHFAEYGEPAPRPGLQLYWSEEKKDVLVEYDETFSRKGDILRRAYFLQENDAAVRAGQRPKFASPARERLHSIPVKERNPGEPEAEGEGGVLALADGHKFTLVGVETPRAGPFELPVYRVRSGRAMQVLLTPPAVIADATIVGGCLFVWWAGSGGFGFTP